MVSLAWGALHLHAVFLLDLLSHLASALDVSSSLLPLLLASFLIVSSLSVALGCHALS